MQKRISEDSKNKQRLSQQNGGIEKYYNLNEASVLLGIKVRTARAWIHEGKMHAVKYPNGRPWYVPESEIIRIRGERS